MRCFLGDPDSLMLNLEAHRFTLAIAKKTLDGLKLLQDSTEDLGQTTTFLQGR